MKKILSLVKGTQGVFVSIVEQNKCFMDGSPVNYRGIEQDKQNLRNDVIHVLSDVRKAMNEAINNSL